MTTPRPDLHGYLALGMLLLRRSLPEAIPLVINNFGKRAFQFATFAVTGAPLKAIAALHITFRVAEPEAWARRLRKQTA